LKEFEDLSVEDRAKVIGGLIIVGVWLVAVLVFVYFFHVEDQFHILARLNSGLPIFNVMPLMLVLVYVFTVLPTVLVGLTVLGMLAKRPFSWTLKGILLTLLMIGAPFLLLALLFGLFALVFSNLPDYAQAPLTILPFFFCGIIAAYAIKTKRINNYLKKMDE
jgi:membrane protease YdiL (CAAX protease family)